MMTCHFRWLSPPFEPIPALFTNDLIKYGICQIRQYLLIGLMLLLPSILLGQKLAGLSTRWDDSFSEWVIFSEVEGFEGDITMRWPMRGDWTMWDFRMGELSGEIKTKWNNDANLWELRADNEIITIRTVWQNDWRQWEVKNGDLQIDIKSRWGNILEEWYCEDKRYGELKMYTAWEGDLRDWVIIDDLIEEISLPTRIAMVFIPVFYATPKF